MTKRPGIYAVLKLLLLTLYLAGGYIRGRTKLQKLAFMVWRRIKRYKGRVPYELTEIRRLKFRPGPYGPVLKELTEEALRVADEKDLIEWSRPINATESFSLTREGEKIAAALAEKLRALGIEIDGTIREYAKLNTLEVIRLVYEEAPGYTVKSVIKDKIVPQGTVSWGILDKEDFIALRELALEGALKVHKTVYAEPEQEVSVLRDLARVTVSMDLQDTIPYFRVKIRRSD